MTDPVDLFENLIRVETRVYNAVDARLRDECALTVGQYQFLRIIDRRTTCRVYDIAHEVAITVGATSKAVDRIEAAGWCRRQHNPEDRRSSLIALTAAGRRKLARVEPVFRAATAEHLAELLPARAAAQLGTALRTLRRELELADRGFPAPDPSAGASEIAPTCPQRT